MHLHRWRFSLPGRVARQRLIAGAMVLAVVVGVLTTSTFLARHAPAVAPGQRPSSIVPLLAQDSTTPRLEVFEIMYGFVYHQWSDDNGATWSNWAGLLQPSNLTFVGTPAVVSDGVGRLTVFARVTGSSDILYDTYATGSWAGWQIVPNPYLDQVQFLTGAARPSGANATVTINILSDPAVTSWGPGRMDLFQYWQVNGATYVMHTWADNDAWSDRVDLLGPSLAFQGNPAAASAGVGHIDVFGRGPNNELEDKWFANGSWHQGWSNLGGVLTSNPAATSLGPGRLDLFARGTDGHVWDLWFSSGAWSAWTDRGCCLAGDVASSVAVTSPTPGTLSLFVLGTLHDLYRKPFTDGVGYGDWQYLVPPDNTNVAAAAWTPPPPPPPPPPPTPTPVPTSLPPCVQPPCTVTP